MSGKVTQGDREGKKLGFPTANLDTLPSNIDIEYGIYAGYTNLEESTEKLPSAIVVRPREDKKTIEVHILDFNEDMYNKQVSVTVKNLVRPWEPFEDREELKKQIESDLEKVRGLLDTGFK